MQKIGNILTNQNMVCSPHINMVNDINCIMGDLPTMVIGYDLVKEFFDEYISIKSTHLVDNFYWTFNKFENNSKYMVDYDDFLTMCLDNYVKSFTYIYIDVIHYRLSKIKKILKKISTSEEVVYFICDDMVYLYVGKLIFGINLEICSYIGLDKGRLLDKVKNISHYGFNKNDLVYKYDDLAWRLKDNKFYLVLFNFLEK